MSEFKRELGPAAWSALGEMAASREPNWWRDLLALWAPSGPPRGERRLRLALRDNYLNFYLKGQSVARVRVGRKGEPVLEVHVKYVFEDAEEQSYAKLTGVEVLRKEGQAGAYEGPATLREWMARAGSWETPEKAQVDQIVSANPTVIDLEMGLPAWSGSKSAFRVDLVALEMANTGTARVVFWEAKRFGDTRLRAKGPAEVMAQVKAYQDFFADPGRQASVRIAYRSACEALVRFAEMDPTTATEIKLDPMIERVATGAVPLEIDPTPRLVIFGSAEEFGRASWLVHDQKLTASSVPVVRLRSDAYALTQGSVD